MTPGWERVSEAEEPLYDDDGMTKRKVSALLTKLSRQLSERSDSHGHLLNECLKMQDLWEDDDDLYWQLYRQLKEDLND